MENHRLFTSLAFAGALPFVFAALLSVVGISALPVFGDVTIIASSYALAIICFLAGTHWAFQLLRASDTPYDLFISSNVAVVLVWFAYLFLSIEWVLVVQAIAFAALLAVDFHLRGTGLLTDRYFRARIIATTAAVLSLAIVVVTG
jgi:hypothetical protein